MISDLQPRLHHVGIVLPTDDAARGLMTLLGLREAYRGYVPQYEALCIFTAGNGATPIEFVIPTGGKLKEFQAGRGGIHHVALQVESLDRLAAQLAAQGMTLLETTPVKGAGPFLCNFLHPAFSQNVIVEFVQTLGESGAHGVDD